MSKQQVAQKYIFKISTARLKKAGWNLTLSLSDARANSEIVSIGDSQVLRWIDELNGCEDSESRVREIRRQIRALRKLENTPDARRCIRKLYADLDALQFKPDYLHLVIDKNRDLMRACKGFAINGIRFVRLLGTSGGVKLSTVVFVNEKLVDELRRRIDNGRDESVAMVPAKFEAYRALTCSGTTPVSMPKGILVVPDCETTFKEDVLYLSDECDGEPELNFVKDYDVKLTESDGYGLMCPALAERWSNELKLGYTACAMTTRMAWEKGVALTFDFVDFAEKIAGNYIVKDVWGNDVDVRNVELILTTSMLKLWSSYNSLEHYLSCCEQNHYTFGVTKTSPKSLEDRRSLNYQFIQSYPLTDAQIDELVRPTINEIKEVIAGDYRKALLFMAGSDLNDENILLQTPYVQAMMLAPEMFNDPFIRQKIRRSIKGRIDDAKIGVIDVHGNYSILGGDPYALCQSIFGLPVTGLLKAGEVYNRYWLDSGANEVVCFRAPMSCAANIKKMKVARGDGPEYWYRYIDVCTLTNAWDTATQAWNGADKDGDILMLTDNPVLLANTRNMPTLYCAQKTAAKSVITEDLLVKANIASFGNDVGRVTNWITSMYDVQARFDPGSEEYKTLEYRIMCGQQYQQNSIDKTKGIVCKQMPRYWHDYVALKKPDENASREAHEAYKLNCRIVAAKKPYFMRYIYPELMADYKKYVKSANMNALCEFMMTIDELESLDPDTLTDRQREFLGYYHYKMVVGTNNCVMNRICRLVERELGSYSGEEKERVFDYSFMKSKVRYKSDQYYSVKRLYDEHMQKVRDLASVWAKERQDHEEDYDNYMASVVTYFTREMYSRCSNEREACDIILDICYKHAGTKQFVWDVIPDLVLHNLAERSGGVMQYPIPDPDGDFTFRGGKYSMAKAVVDIEQYHPERV